MTRKHEYIVKTHKLDDYKTRLKKLDNEIAENVNKFNNFVLVHRGSAVTKDEDIKKTCRRIPTILDAYTKMKNKNYNVNNEILFLIKKIANMSK